MSTLPATTDAASLMAVITNAAKDQSVDVMKLTQLMDLYERIENKRAEREFSDAMNACQAEMRAISQDAANPQTRSKYASYVALDGALRPIYTKHGFSLSFDTAEGAPEGCVRVVCKVAHKSGYSERPHIDMPNDGKGAKGGDVMTKTHATMSAVSYARRGLLKMVFNVSEGEYDDDGNAATVNGQSGYITADQADRLNKILADHGFDVAGFLKFANIDSIATMPAAKFEKAMIALDAKVRANKDAGK